MKKVFFILIVLSFITACTATPGINIVQGNIIMELSKSAPNVITAAVSPDGKYILSGDRVSGTVRLWDRISGKEVRKFVGQGSYIKTLLFSPDMKHVAAGSGNGSLTLWSMKDGKELVNIKGYSERIYNMIFTPDGRYLVTTGADIFISSGSLKLWDLKTGQEIQRFKENPHLYALAISPDGKKIFSAGRSGPLKDIRLYDLATGNVIRKFERSKALLGDVETSLAVSPDGNHIACSGNYPAITEIWNVSTGERVGRFNNMAGPSGSVTVKFSPDGRYLVWGGDGNEIVFWDISSGREVKRLKGHSGSMGGVVSVGSITSLTFSPDGKYLISTSFDSSIRIWDLITDLEVAAIVGFEDGDWIVITSDGYYNSSEKGAQYLSVKVGDNSYGVDSFYDVFYRPDIVAAKLRGDDIKDLITITMQDAIKTPPPSIEFTTSETDKPKAKICYQAKSTGGGIGEVRLFHNGKLVESDGYYREVAKTEKNTITALNSKAIYDEMRSVSIKGFVEKPTITKKIKGDIVEDCEEIETISGENEISITAFNRDNTIQGAMKTIKFNSKTQLEEPNLYILAIGINEYKDKSITLKYAAKDARDMQEKLIKQAATIYDPKNIKYAFIKDAEATKVNVISKINDLSKTIKPNDSFILFIAGHGVLLQNQYYILTNDYDGTIDTNNMISSNEIVEMSKKIKSLSQLFIFDTCHAGGVDTIISGLYDARMSVLAKKMGLHIYASANSLQQALDGYQNNGLFTYTLLDGLNNKKEADQNKDNSISLIELGEYTKQTTTEISKKLEHQQTPLIINFGKDNAVYKLK